MRDTFVTILLYCMCGGMMILFEKSYRDNEVILMYRVISAIFLLQKTFYYLTWMSIFWECVKRLCSISIVWFERPQHLNLWGHSPSCSICWPPLHLDSQWFKDPSDVGPRLMEEGWFWKWQKSQNYTHQEHYEIKMGSCNFIKKITGMYNLDFKLKRQRSCDIILQGWR